LTYHRKARSPGLLLALAVLLPGGASRTVAAQGEQIAFDRPESWALKYFAAVTTFTPLGPPVERQPWQMDLGLELGWIPSLSEDQRRVGFEGTKVEDLNKLPVFARPRVTVAFPARFLVELAWVPPVEVNGVKPNLLDVALERPLLGSGRWTLGVRAYGQLGSVQGDFTCPKEVVSSPPGSPANPYGCQEPSSDTSTLNDIGMAVTGGASMGRGAFHFAGGATYNHLRFQVHALTFGYEDRTLLLTDGWTGWVAAGAGWPLGAGTWLGGEAFYSPLTVRRPPETNSQNDPLFTVRAMLRIRLR
jgi:hypothetical protein